MPNISWFIPVPEFQLRRGFPIFEGPKGVWTLEQKGKKPEMNLSWDEAKPTTTHMALKALVDAEKVKFIVSQNIDGLHLRSGIPREKIAELHGNMFIDKCSTCQRMFVRPGASETVGQKTSGDGCPGKRPNGRSCRGKVHDFTLDWEHELPDDDLDLSDAHSVIADLSIVLGSTLQIIPSGTLPTYVKKYESVTGGKLVIINLQPTKHDKKADLAIRTYVDDVMKLLFDKLDMKIPGIRTGQRIPFESFGLITIRILLLIGLKVKTNLNASLPYPTSSTTN